MNKLIIHETDCHGSGWFYYNGEARQYYYDDDETGNVKAAVQALIEIGYINENDVMILEGEEIYKYINVNNEGKFE